MKERSCGTCSACCTALGVAAIDKKPNTPCEYQVGKGCSIYERRPDECRTYTCGWLAGAFEGRDRPDRIGVVFDAAGPNGRADHPDEIVVIAREVQPGAADRAWRQVALVARANLVIIMRLDGTRRVEGPAPLVKAYAAKHLPMVQT